jgi:hypothetical protein
VGEFDADPRGGGGSLSSWAGRARKIAAQRKFAGIMVHLDFRQALNFRAIDEATVKSHINHLLPKINARDRAQAVRYAYQHGLAQQ